MNPNDLYLAAQEALRTGRYEECDRLLAQLEAAVGPHSATAHLRAHTLREQGLFDQALREFDRALLLAGEAVDPFIFANRAEVAGLSGRPQEADSDSEKALSLLPANDQLRSHRATILHRYLGEAAADRFHRDQIASSPQDSACWHRYALFLRSVGRVGEAAAAIDRARALNPGSTNARLLAAHIALDRGKGEPGLTAVLASSVSAPTEHLFPHVAGLVGQGKVDEGLALLDAAIGSERTDIDELAGLRVTLSQEYFGPRAAEEFLNALVKHHPANIELAARRINFLWRAYGAERALEEMEVFDQATSGHLMEIMRAELLSEAGRMDQADALYDRLADFFDKAPAVTAMARVRHLFRAQRVEAASSKAFDLARHTGLVEAWAHVELGWRLTGDARWSWLTRDGALVRYEALAHFEDYRSELVALLRRLHESIGFHPLQQSPRNGTQTDGHFLWWQEEPVNALRADIERTIGNYIGDAELNAGGDHPLDRLATMTPLVVGSWSVRLTTGGYHTPHFHNQGILSSACHVSLPDGTGESGILQFGSAPASLGLDVAPFAQVVPREGHFALFPSFFFHDVRAFGDGERLVVACDVASV